jgi:hypothetical protein
LFRVPSRTRTEDAGIVLYLPPATFELWIERGDDGYHV